MSLGNYKILNPSRTFRLSLIFFPLAFHCFPFDQFRKKSWKRMAVKKKALIIKTVPTFRYLLLCFCIVFAENLRSLSGMRSRQKAESAWNMSCLCVGAVFSRSTKHREFSSLGSDILCDIFISEHKADARFCSLGVTNICQLLSIRFVAPVLASLYVPQRLQKRGPQLIAQIIKFNIYLNKYNEPAVWQGTQFIKCPCLFVVSLIKI